MRRVLAPLLAALLLAAMAAPSLAAGPQRGCPPRPGWQLITPQAFYTMSVQHGMPPLTGADYDAYIAGFLAALDKNGDGLACYKDFRPTQTPAFPDYVWNVVDNVSNH